MRLTLTGLGHRFGDGPWLFRHLDRAFDRGDVVALVGPSGSGKSTLLAVISGQLTPAEGGVDGAAGRMRWVFQNPHGVARRSAADHVALPLLAVGRSRDEADARAREILAELGLAHVADAPFAQLSGGEAQRLMLGRAWAAAPDVLLVDEPTAQLDRATALEVASRLHVLAGHGAVVIIATHDPMVIANCPQVLDLGGESA